MLPHYLPKVIEWLDSKLLSTRAFNRYFSDSEEVRVPDHPISDPKGSSRLQVTEVALKINGAFRLFIYREVRTFCPATIIIIVYEQYRKGVPNNLYSNLKKAYPNYDVQIWDWDERRMGLHISSSTDIGEQYSARMKATYLRLIKENGLEHLEQYRKKERR